MVPASGTAEPAHTDDTAATVTPCPADATVMDGWNDRAPPRRIFGNTWYVGTCGLSALLVTSDQGHVLLDGATEAAGPLIEANIRALGFDPKDVKYLLNTHEHHDHAAGLAYLQGVTGAPLLAREPAIATLRNGRSGRDDPQQLEPHSAFPPVARVEAIGDDGIVQVGPLTLTAHATPGHTPGGTSWTWRSCGGTRCLDMAYTDSTSAISDHAYRYLDHPAMVAAFRRGLDTLAALPCDIQMTPHPRASDLFDRLQGVPGKPLVDAGACERYARAGRANLEKRLDDETRGLKP
ncbi:subclass B3 metallo-beta-lactamase [Flavobacterium sp. MXW15]|uniref:Subclass B3 metallo-beta-lactamase n=1 Tax=Xanthomonas chitinilytica TaxID=2989819 RepID=A0ABT3JV93_9XANT|nr:subclass B3 metallo-beta-lactamase [Xanthomonas sp. H13-6]MCW4454960.1 subclass B3 metallo-beta-lactamase [Flavobacterium sp. MXW15]MCW4472413.1 subclass B3 metallo-beta-lactamase [Xanthomonas sp. H13-6]